MRKKPTRAYLGAFRELYNTKSVDPLGLPRVAPKKAKKPSKLSLVPKEIHEQFVAVCSLRKMGVPFYHIPNGGFRNPIEAAKFKRLGVSAGVPDLCIPMARKGYHGLYIELKRISGGRLSPPQIEWARILTKEGYLWAEAKGAKDCIKIVEDYLS